MSMTTTIQQTCECGQAFGAEHDPAWPDFTASHCPECTARERAEQEEEHRRYLLGLEAENAEKAAVAREAKVDDLTPRRILLTDPLHADFNGPLWAKVQAWCPSDSSPWLGLVGEPGACKTRVMFMRARQLARGFGKGFSVATISGPDFGTLVMRQFDRTSAEFRPEGWIATKKTTVGALAAKDLEQLRWVDLLLFDELGKSRPTPATVSELFSLIDARYSENLATIWTSNTTPETFCRQWPEEFGGPGAGRIIEASTIIQA